MEQLLLRERIILDTKNISQYIAGKKILITGAAGSIGSELVKQILPFNPACLYLIDQSETGIHDLQTEIGNNRKITFKIASITDEDQMTDAFQDFKPDVVFHAAAYKHVPILENQPQAAIKNNIIGTQILCDLAVCHHVEKFIFISTDKAVKPVSVMGMSKRISELYLFHLNSVQSKTQFIITRFGNVLGTSGSVYPTFQKQIRAGGPVTVTHPTASRYFMISGEAVQLVLEAAAIGKGGQVMIFDMGEPILITELAKRMIEEHSRSTNTAKVSIIFSGLRNGEKLHEELFYEEEKVSHVQGKLKVSQPEKVYTPDIHVKIIALRSALETATPDLLKSIMKDICSKNTIRQKQSVNSGEAVIVPLSTH